MNISLLEDHSESFIIENRKLATQAEETKNLWQDEVRERFYAKYVDRAVASVNHYLNGDSIYGGKGLLDFTSFVNNKINEFNSL